LTVIMGILPLATGPGFGVGVCWSGDPATGERVIAPLRRLGTPVDDTIRRIPYLEMQSMLSPPPMRVGSYARSAFLRELNDEVIDVMAARAAAPSTGLSLFFLEHLHGRVSTVGRDESSFPHRKAAHTFTVLSLWLDPNDAETATADLRGFFDQMAPFLASAVYSNYMADEGSARVRAAYGDAWDRLVRLKRVYDPENVFRLNQNIDPSAAANRAS